MLLSIVIPTHRRGLRAFSRVAQACSWAGPDVEVIVRDNSGDPEKREMLSHLHGGNCNIIAAEPCEGLENFAALLRMAKGEFIFQLADDDFCFDRAVKAFTVLLAQVRSDPSVVGITGAFVLEATQASGVVSYSDVDSPDPLTRLNGYLGYNGANVLMYAPVRRALARNVFEFMSSMPTYFSFHDQIQCLLYLLSGKFVRLDRMIYSYDVGPWDNPETAQQRDLEFYRAAGLDPAINKLQWFLCGLEGAALTMNSTMFPHVGVEERQQFAARWLSEMFGRFRIDQRTAFDSRLGDKADLLCAALQASLGKLSLPDMVTEVAGFIALFSNKQAKSYFDFWNAILLNRAPLPADVLKQ